MYAICEGMGFRHLSSKEQQVYKIILQTFSTSADFFDCSNIDRSVDVMRVIQIALGDNPSVVYFNKNQIQMEEAGGSKRFILSGLVPKPEAAQMNLALDDAVNKAISYINTASQDEYSLLLKLYEYLQENTKYDTLELQAMAKGRSTNPNSHNAFGALVNKTAVCDGFASAFVLLAKNLGFDCMLVVGTSAYDTGKSTGHAWNIVKIGNKKYHMDATWDARRFREFDEYSYAYFAVSDEDVNYDHYWDNLIVPPCMCNDLSYYVKYGLYAGNFEQAVSIIKSARHGSNDLIRLRISQKAKLPDYAGDRLAQVYMDAVSKSGVRIQVSYGWNINTRCFIAKTM